MQTDPISAATAYRQALEQVCAVTTLQAARAVAAQALRVGFTRPGEESLSVASGFGGNSGQPYVAISQSTSVVQLDLAAARTHALFILEACAAAEGDGFLVTWLRGAADLAPGQIGALLADFRAWKDAQRFPQITDDGADAG